MTLALLVAVALCAEPADAPIRVSPGTQQVLKIAGLTKVAIPDTPVADVAVTGPGELMVVGHKPGRITMTMWVKGKVTTRPVIVDDGKFAEVAALVKEKVDPSLKTEVFGEKLIIDGQVDSVEDYNRLRALVADYPNVKLLVKLNPLAMPALANLINSELRKQGLMNATVKALGNRLVLEGSVTDELEKAKAGMIAESFYSDFHNGK